jgi:uncharacterized protein (TIGR03437 family)
MGGSHKNNEGFSVAVDGSGNVYTTGFFEGTVDFDPGLGVFNLTGADDAGLDVFVSKLDSAGNFVWARQMGGSSFLFADDSGRGVAVDGSGNVYTTGLFRGTLDFDPGAGVFNLAGRGDIFVAKYTDQPKVTDPPPEGDCYDISGTWSGEDRGSLTCTVSAGGMTETDTDNYGGSGTVEIEQELGSCSFYYDPVSSGGGSPFAPGRRTGEIDGNRLTISGPFGVPLPGVTLTTNTFEATGQIQENRIINLAGSGRVKGTLLGDGGVLLNVDCSASSTAMLSRVSPPRVPPEIPPVSPTVPEISAGGIVLATLLPNVSTISPLSIISVFGIGFSTETILSPNLDQDGKLATTLGGTCVEIGGERSPIFAITPTQANVQTPATITTGPVSVVVITGCGTATQAVSAAVSMAPANSRALSPSLPQAISSEVAMVTVEAVAPAFFLFPPLAADGLIAARFNSDAVVVAPDGRFADQYGRSRPAVPGDIIVLYGTGWGETTAALGTGELASGAAELLPGANPTVSFGGVVLAPEDVLYVGVTPNTAGLYQLVIRVPAVAIPGSQQIPGRVTDITRCGFQCNQVILTVYGKSTPVGPVIPTLLFRR